jgi:hypothetical protein
VIPSRWLGPILTVAAIVVPSAATAQQVSAPPAAAPQRPRELTIGAFVAAPASLGTRSADLTRPDGTPLELFRTNNRDDTRVGVEATMTFPLWRRFAVEAAGSWSSGDVESRIEHDFEGADLGVASTSLTRFAIEGGALFDVTRRPRWTWFVRGTAGWMRELTSDNVIAKDGVVGNVGTGVKYWWREPAAGRRGMGLRVEGRANLRSGGVVIGEDKVRVAGVVSGGFVIGW